MRRLNHQCGAFASARWALICLLGIHAISALADTLIDNFSGANSPSPWTFSNGPEFPGATGTLTLGAGYLGGHSAQIAYDLSKGGDYTGAFLTLPTPLTAAAISFWVKSPSNIQVAVRIVDTSGQTLQYNLNRPVESMNTSNWYQQIVELDAPSLFFSGDNDGVVHNPIVSIGILTTNGVEPSPVGTINFTDVYAVSSTAFTLDPGVPLAPPNSGNGSLLSGMGVTINIDHYEQGIASAASAGFSWVRTDLSWSTVETTQGSYDFTEFDQLLGFLEAYGLKPVFTLDYGNPLYTGSLTAPPTTPAAIAAFANFAQVAAIHYAGTGARFEIWHEADLAAYWPPAPSPTQYAALAAATIAAVHAGDPSAMVSTTGLSGFDFTFAQGFLAAGGGAGADAIGVDPYDIPDAAGELTDYYTNLQATVAPSFTAGAAPPIWETEWGYSSTDYSPAGTLNGADPGALRTQASLAAKEILSAYAVGFPFYCYYDLVNDGTDPTYRGGNFGLLNTDFSDKPAMTAVRQIAAVASGRTFSGFIHTAPSSLVAMRFDGPNDSVVALWSFAPNSHITVSVAGNGKAVDVLGAPIALQNGTLVVSDAGGPVYVTFTGNAWLSNLSARALVQGQQNLLIAGFVTTGTSNKSLLIRGDGPSLGAFGVTGFLADPELTLFASGGAMITSTESWAPALSSTFTQVGAFQFAAGSHDTALLESVAPGAYTAQIASSTTLSGVGLAEIYDADSGAPANRLINISARALVGTGSNLLIGGFVITGTGEETLLIRADGPALTGFGVGGALANPVLTLLNSSGAVIGTNTGWGNPSVVGSGAVAAGPLATVVLPATSALFSKVGAFTLSSGSADSAFLVTLPPGSYTAQVSGANSGTGVALVEIYEAK
jgi:hypothetical protein